MKRKYTCISIVVSVNCAKYSDMFLARGYRLNARSQGTGRRFICRKTRSVMRREREKMSSYLNLPVSRLSFSPYFWYKIATKHRKQSHHRLAQAIRRRRNRPVHTVAHDSRIKLSSHAFDDGKSKGWTSTGERLRKVRRPLCQMMHPALTAKSPHL